MAQFENIAYMNCVLNSSGRPEKIGEGHYNGEASNSKKQLTATDDVLKGLVEWLCAQV